MRALRIGTRGSALARRQVEIVTEALRARYPGIEIETVVLQTEGDRRADVSLEEMGGQGVFVKDIEGRLLAGEVDLAVHSLKDMPADSPQGLALAAVL
ncbi:MAG TPA: hydroxymethylbilane synthase, partial [Dehalococcoidia bacterium]